LVTGASRGIGKAIVENLLNMVTGSSARHASRTPFRARQGLSCRSTFRRGIGRAVRRNDSISSQTNRCFGEQRRDYHHRRHRGTESRAGQSRLPNQSVRIGANDASSAAPMRRQAAGRIVNIGSVAGFLPTPFQAAHAATKHALAGWTETLDLEVRRFGIRAIQLDLRRNWRHMSGEQDQRRTTMES
jgi:NAD(P)-dependent dehydrogenase (short-subunit alcohol dehydrogenase family)